MVLPTPPHSLSNDFQITHFFMGPEARLSTHFKGKVALSFSIIVLTFSAVSSKFTDVLKTLFLDFNLEGTGR